MSELREYLFGEKLNKIKTFKYEFDDFGNWINCILFIDDSPKYILLREIEYFK